MVWKIKQIPQDFIVKEIPLSEKVEEWREKINKLKGVRSKKVAKDYVWFTLKKKNLSTFEALKIIAKKLGISINRFGYAGVKDKRSVSQQTISVYRVGVKKLKSIRARNIKLSDFKSKSKSIRLGMLEGNLFEITVRNINKNEISKIREKISLIKKNGVLNLFDSQRFGLRNVTPLVGKKIIKGKFKQAIWIYLTKSSKEKAKNFRDMLKLFPKTLKYEIAILNYLIKNPDDYIGALRELPKTLRMMFVHAYQAFLWNKTAMAFFKKGQSRKNITIPLVGYKTNLNKYSETKSIIKNILLKEKIKPSDFKIHSIPELNSKGEDRELLVYPKKLKYKFEKDEINFGRFKLVLKFELPKGSYATQVIKTLNFL